MADGGEEGAEVMHGTEEDAADYYPQEDGDPAENCSLDRSVNGACTGYGREMVAHQNGGVGGNKILSVVAGVCRGLMRGVNAPLLRQEAAVEDVTKSQQHQSDQHDKNCAHTFHSLNKKC